ncbi:DUF58 domain-containing protein [Gorillibacterium timonense]|uniref:DUF58 domain-containing protein n=1 Tax=Gorillibacterium timonense TaxID=1689269 RepID=UPI00071DB8AD|nr:DUF58 domain-containing protein [Gorillibacterium timonense]
MNLSYRRDEPKKVRFSRRYGLILAFFLISLLFLLFQGGKFAYMVFIIVAILCVYIILGRWSGIAKAEGKRGVSGASKEMLSAGTSLAITVDVHVPGIWPLPYVGVRDTLHHLGVGSTTFETTLIPDWKRNGQVSYRTHPLRRGHYRFERTECTTGDVFGVFEHRGRIELPHSFSVLPETIAISEWNGLKQMMRGVQHHSITTRAQRETTQINGVREYNYGDRLSRIHWNATARTGTWKSKEFERESELSTLIILDRQSDRYPDKESFELAVSTAASLLEFGQKRRLSVGLLSVGREAALFEPKSGSLHFKTMMDHLIGVEADGSYPLARILEEHGRSLVPGMLAVLVTPEKNGGAWKAMNWIHHKQLNGCQILAGAEAGLDHQPWVKFMQARGFLAYPVASLQDLPVQLGGRG